MSDPDRQKSRRRWYRVLRAIAVAAKLGALAAMCGMLVQKIGWVALGVLPAAWVAVTLGPIIGEKIGRRLYPPNPRANPSAQQFADKPN
jgi:hypothetical protein